MITVQETSGDKELIRGIGKVSSVGFGVECECMLHKNRNYRSAQSRDINQPLKNAAAYSLPAEHFYIPCTVQHPENVCPQLSPAHKRKSTEYNYSVIHCLMSYIVSTMLSDL